MKYCLIFLFLFIHASCNRDVQESNYLSKRIIKKIYPAIVEVVIPKIEDENIVYERDLPWDRLPFKERNDKFHSIGTAFFINKTKLISAAHVFGADEFSHWTDFHIRTVNGEVFKIDKISKYSQYKDIIEFDLKSYPKNYSTLKLEPRIEIGDMVYTVGNAQGEGISTRGGQVSNFTPEHVNGNWKFIRFSSPASPGNSGGPLVNRKGEVVGIVVMKNNSENLNFALPVSELESISKTEADFFIRNIRVQDDHLVVTDDWKFKASLPSKISELKKSAPKSKESFYEELVDKFKSKYKKKIFPFNPHFRNTLRHQNLPAIVGHIEKDQSLTNWKVLDIPMKKLQIAPKQFFYYGQSKVFPHIVLIEKSKNETLQDFWNDDKKMMELIALGLGMGRNLAGERIPIISYGTPSTKENWKDIFGRNWRESSWFVKYDNSILTKNCTPLPTGVLCLLKFMWAPEWNEGHRIFTRENVEELVISYSGELDNWLEYVQLSKNEKPSFFESFKAQEDNNSYQFSFNKNNINLPKKYFKQDSLFTLQVGYSPNDPWKMQPVKWDIKLNKNKKIGISFITVLEPNDLSDEAHHTRWSELKSKTGSFSKDIHQENSLRVLRIEMNRIKNQKFLLDDSKFSSLEIVYYKKCYSDFTKNQSWFKTFCHNTIFK